MGDDQHVLPPPIGDNTPIVFVNTRTGERTMARPPECASHWAEARIDHATGGSSLYEGQGEDQGQSGIGVRGGRGLHGYTAFSGQTTFYYNRMTGERTWVCPDEFVPAERAVASADGDGGQLWGGGSWPQ